MRAAASVLSTRGIGGTRMGDIAEEVGVKPPSIYYHFKDIREILETLLDYTVYDLSEYIAMMKEGTPPSECIYALIYDQINRLNESGLDVWFVTESAQLSKFEFKNVTRKVKAWRRDVGKIYLEGKKQGEFAAMDKPTAVAAISGITYGAYRLVHNGGKADSDTFAALTVRALKA